jgi:hypothetical protein
MKKILREECELIGALIGDGHISTKCGKYIVGFTGNKVTDREYFEHLERLIFVSWGKRVKVKITQTAVRIKFDSKQIVERLTNFFGIPANEGKGQKAVVPPQVCSDWALARNAIRGLFDTDGSIFVSDKRGSPKYPSIELTTTSNALARQIRLLLSMRGFCVANIWGYCSKRSRLTAYKVPLNGRQNLKKWLKEIGFSNPYKRQRAREALVN